MNTYPVDRVEVWFGGMRLKPFDPTPALESASAYVARWCRLHDVHLHILQTGSDWIDVEFNGAELIVTDLSVQDGRAASKLYDLVYGVRPAPVPY